MRDWCGGYTCNSSYLEGSWFQASPCKKIATAISSNKLVISGTCQLSHKDSRHKRIAIQACWDINIRPYLKNNQSEKGWEHGSGCRETA
jgi:hypothetical protein